MSNNPRSPIVSEEKLETIERSISDGVMSFDWTTVLDLTAQIRSLREECEYRRDTADTERLGRRKAEEWLTSIKETFRPWWQSDRSNWDGSLCGLPVVVAGVADTVRKREEAAGWLLRASTQLTNAFEKGRVQDRHWWQAKKAIDLATEAGIVASE